MYNEDLDASPPASWTGFREQIASFDALLFVTPEYNRSMPGCLKNATDIGSRPEGQNVFAGRPAAVVSVSPYSMGGFGANHAMRQSFVYLDLAVMQQPEAYIGNAKKLMDGRGRITSHDTDAFLTNFMAAFKSWIESVGTSSQAFDDFLSKREAASFDYINGKVDALLEMSGGSDSVTFFPPSGDRIQGAKLVNRANEKGARSFLPGSKGHFEVMQQGSNGNLGFWTGVQHAKVKMPGRGKPVPMTLRITEVFRVENGGWKLIHRHADIPKEKG